MRHASKRGGFLSFYGERVAFTLVEILVTIGVIAVLLALLIPVLGKVRESAKTTRCISNLRQLGLATAMYLPEHENIYPRDSYWAKQIGPYLDAPWDGWEQPLPDSKNPFMCPAADVDELTLNYNQQLAYGINCDVVANRSVEQILLNRPQMDESTIVLYADCWGVNLWGWASDRFGFGWHPSGINAVYLDMHVESTGITDSSDPKLDTFLRY